MNEKLEALVQKWIEDQRTFTERAELARASGNSKTYHHWLAKRNQLELCRRELQEVAGLVVKWEDLK